jgi:hypothetical protein
MEFAKEAVDLLGFEFKDAKLCRVRGSIHVDFPASGVIARVEPPGSEQLAKKIVQVARFWANVEAPVAQLVQPENQPIVSEEGAVTVWVRHDAGKSVGERELGRVARSLHESSLQGSTSGLPRAEFLSDVQSWLGRPTSGVGESERQELLDRATILASWWKEMASADPLGATLLHGDLHEENAIVTRKGVVLVDLEDSGVGPMSWDFVPVAVSVRRFGRPERRFLEFVEGYGQDPREWGSFEKLCEIYELSIVVWALRCRHLSKDMAKEAAIRLRGFLNGSSETWTLV